MQRSKMPSTQSIPFIAGKSLNKSHNIGIRIQQTKSLIIKSPTNKKLKQQQKPPDQSSSQTDDKQTYIIDRTSSATNVACRNKTGVCPVLKLQNQSRSKIENLQIDEDSSDKNGKEKSIEELWAEYMFDVESENIVPVKCTCYPLTYKNRAIKDERKTTNTYTKQSEEDLSIYKEARRLMNNCSAVLTISEEEVCRENLYLKDHQKQTRSTKMAFCMQQIKQLEDRLAVQNN